MGIAIVIAFILAHIFIFDICAMLTSRFKWAVDAHKWCWKKCDKKNPLCGMLAKARGDHYYLGETELDYRSQINDSKFCWLGSWHISHILTHACLGFFTENLWLSLGAGIGFEFYEMLRFDCHDSLDIVWNTVGFFLGYMIKQLTI
jgi:hypothetical protein